MTNWFFLNDSLAQSWVSNNFWFRFLLLYPIRKLMGKNLFITESFSVEIMLVHFTSISVSPSRNFNILNTSSQTSCRLGRIIVPHSYNEISEVSVSFNLSVDNHIPFFEVLKSNLNLIAISKSIICTMHCSK